MRSAGAAADDDSGASCHSAPSTDGVQPLEECLHSFWQVGPELDSIQVDPAQGPEVEDAVMKRLGDSPFIGKANLASVLSKAYRIAGRAALQKAAGENGGAVRINDFAVHF